MAGSAGQLGRRGIIESPSPNHGARRGVAAPDMIVLHYTGMASGAAALARLRDPAPEVSAHWLVMEDGAVHRLVPEARRAWHAGVAQWGGVRDVNSHSVGIEIANPGPDRGCPPYGAAQMRAVEALVSAAMARWGIPPERVVGHSDVAPGRKIDPGAKLDWRRLARLGLAIWPAEAAGAAQRMAGDCAAGAFQQAARAFGYGAPATAVWDSETMAVLEAMRLRFAPFASGAPPGAADLRRIAALAARWPVAV